MLALKCIYHQIYDYVCDTFTCFSQIMHCVLEQIEATEEERIPPSEEKPPPRQDGLHPEMATILGNMAMKLALNDKEREV